jgi:hypothetical protein
MILLLQMMSGEKGYTVSDLKKLLTELDIPFGKENKSQLLRLCVDHGLIDPPKVEYKTIEKTCIVKCALRKAMALDYAEFCTFRQYVDKLVNIVSRMLRRSSLALAFHMTRLISEGLKIPDLYEMNDTYWKNWLKIGVDDIFPDIESRDSYNQIKNVLGVVLDSTIVGDFVKLKQNKYPAHIDQVLNYAGHTLRTIVTNNAWVPLFARLASVTTAVMKSFEKSKLKTYDVMQAIRGKEPKMDGWNADIKDYVNDVRSRLCLKKDACMYDNYGKDISFETIFKFNHWMQTQLERTNYKRLALMPICDVQRAHIRLDKKTLLHIFFDLFREDPNIRKLIKMNTDNTYRNPDNFMLPSRPTILRKKDCISDDQWERYKEVMKSYEKSVNTIKTSQEYIDQHKLYMTKIDAQNCVISTFFKRLPKKQDWDFDCSIATDGVSVSLQYSKKVRIQIDHMKSSDKPPKQKATQYDKFMDTLVPGTNIAVLGVDPGRCNMATVTYQINGQGNMWKLTRGAYYNDSGIKKRKKQYNERFAHLSPKWAKLGGEGTALRTSNAQEIQAYLHKYNEFSEEWWGQVLHRRESRDKFQKYIGKRKVMDSFWANVNREFKKLHSDKIPQIAYGSAIITMKPTGKGETAVPTGSMFSSCKRIFKDQVVITDEFRTTKVSWETGTVSEHVYKKPSIVTDNDGKIKLGPETLHHTNNSIPDVDPQDELALWVYNTRKRVQDTHRKGGFVETTVNKSLEKRYPEVRGLRFSPETNMYFDRDRSAALTIARLRCMESQGLGRPLPFTRGFEL